MSRAMDTMVVENEFGAVLKYPESFRVSLVQSPHDSTCIRQVSEKTQAPPDGTPGTVKKHKKKRVRKTALNRGEILQMEYHREIKEDVMRCYTSLIGAGRKIGYFPVQDSGEKAASSGLDLQSLCDLDALVPVQYQQDPLWLERDSDCNVDVFGRMICNPADHSLTVNAFERKFLIPSHSSFLLSDFSKMELLCGSEKYSLIVIDPPWENRSAIRGKKYRWLSLDQLLGLPIPRLANEGALVVVWVTNKRKLANFVKEVLFPSWQVACAGEWHWIKVTTHGDLVFDMDSKHKKPYETLILGRFHEKSLDSHVLHSETTSTHQSHTVAELPFHAEVVETRQPDNTSSALDLVTPSAKRYCQERSLEKTHQTNYEMHKEHDCSKDGIGEVYKATSIPYHRVIVCIPSNIHSQKPYLGDILSKYLPKEKQCLELFARNLLPGWTSWGNEVLKYQEINQPHSQCQKNKLEASTSTLRSELKQD